MKTLRINFSDGSNTDYEVGENYIMPYVINGVLRFQLGEVEVMYNWQFVTNVVLADTSLLIKTEKDASEPATAS